MSDEKNRTPDLPEASAAGDNHRHTGARKFVERPGEALNSPSRDDASSDKKYSVRLMDSTIEEETHQGDGVNPPASFAKDVAGEG